MIGGNAVAIWVSRVHEGAVRNTRDMDILIRRSDLDSAKAAMGAAGFDYAQVLGVDNFIERPRGNPSEGIHLVIAGDKVNPDDVLSLARHDGYRCKRIVQCTVIGSTGSDEAGFL